MFRLKAVSFYPIYYTTLINKVKTKYYSSNAACSAVPTGNLLPAAGKFFVL